MTGGCTCPRHLVAIISKFETIDRTLQAENLLLPSRIIYDSCLYYLYYAMNSFHALAFYAIVPIMHCFFSGVCNCSHAATEAVAYKVVVMKYYHYYQFPMLCALPSMLVALDIVVVIFVLHGVVPLLLLEML